MPRIVLDQVHIDFRGCQFEAMSLVGRLQWVVERIPNEPWTRVTVDCNGDKLLYDLLVTYCKANKLNLLRKIYSIRIYAK